MRVVKEIPHPACKITIYAWNNRYLIKLEDNLIEQTFKVSELDFTGDSEVVQLIDETFINQAIARFNEMKQSLIDAERRLTQ